MIHHLEALSWEAFAHCCLGAEDTNSPLPRRLQVELDSSLAVAGCRYRCTALLVAVSALVCGSVDHLVHILPAAVHSAWLSGSEVRSCQAQVSIASVKLEVLLAV